jgi:hypothetical protein
MLRSSIHHFVEDRKYSGKKTLGVMDNFFEVWQQT